MRDHITEGVWKTTESNYKCGVQFTYWKPGEPNNDNDDHESCAAIAKLNNGKWHDFPCHKEIPFVCQLYV